MPANTRESPFSIAAYVKLLNVRVLFAGSALVDVIVKLRSPSVLGSAAAIAFPIAWWATNRWLQEYAYHVNIAWWLFVLAAIRASLVALLTVSYQALKAAMSNPVNSLRSE